ncbi:YkvA family protein [Amycolatopsis sp. cmx-4-54]|uniref:YkvA family protein n=1 Tax=Amycolatopsis sp. cmx-4-54 TaxID=2790936 RepID=UPI00397A5A5E
MESLWTTLGVVALVVVVVLVLVALFLVVKLVRKHRQVHQPGTPVPTKVAYWISLAYTVFPFDLLPDPVYIDDIVVLTSGLFYVSRSLTKKARDDRRAE